ncbi:proline-rich protein 15-like [Antennarius striatus]|uniref:proline-rich protein 15-like n=1 Tax=Antennarius striatus TaxID=241820 RepID=UPI0035AE1934
MTTERAKWWKAFLPKKKSGGSKDPAAAHTFDPDFDPFAQPEKHIDPPSTASHPSGDQPKQTQCEPNNTSSHYSDDTYDDSKLDSLFNEQSCRRNMKVSRSGRFKEKRRARSTLPLQEKDTEICEDKR